MSDNEKKPPTTLTDDDIVTDKGRDLGRRDAVSVLGVAAAGAAALATGCYGRRARVVQVTAVRTGITDRDGGPCADPAGGGRGVTGITDADRGGCSDPAGRGRGARAVQVVQPVRVQAVRVTDRDSGACSDPAGGGRGYSGLTDSDSGYCSDPAGRGRSGR